MLANQQKKKTFTTNKGKNNRWKPKKRFAFLSLNPTEPIHVRDVTLSWIETTKRRILKKDTHKERSWRKDWNIEDSHPFKFVNVVKVWWWCGTSDQQVFLRFVNMTEWSKEEKKKKGKRRCCYVQVNRRKKHVKCARLIIQNTRNLSLKGGAGPHSNTHAVEKKKKKKRKEVVVVEVTPTRVSIPSHIV